MAVVVVILLIGFVGGTALQQILERVGQGRKRVLAYFYDNKKITQYDLDVAQMELEILKSLRSPVLLRSLPLQTSVYNPVLDLNALLLGELLFPETGVSAHLVTYIRQIRTPQGYAINDKQIDDIYSYAHSTDLIWFLLKNEAHQAGINTPHEQAKNSLGQIIPQLFDGASYKQLISSLVSPPARTGTRGVPEKTILYSFANLLDVIEYSRIICSSENLTEQQIKCDISLARQTLDAEFVAFDASLFTDQIPEPNNKTATDHFEKYKNFFPGQISEQNPYGFGYKLPDRIQLQYIAVKLDDVEKIIEKPTNQQALEFFEKNKQNYTTQVPSDPNDPYSPLTVRQLTYPEVKDIILQKLEIDRIDLMVNTILQKAKSVAEAALGIDPQMQNITEQQFRKIADNYETVAEQLKNEFNVNIHTGTTGLLSAADIQKDRYLGGLFLEGYGFDPVYNPNRIWLHQIALAVDKIGSAHLGIFDVQRPHMYENIGPLKDFSRRIRALVRIVKAQKASVSENIDVTFSTETLNLAQNENQQNQNEEKIYSVKDNVTEDLKKFDAMKIAEEKALRFLKLADETDWKNAIDEFNKLYPVSPNDIDTEPNNFYLGMFTSVPRMSETELETFKINARGNPLLQLSARELEIQKSFMNKLYSLVPPDANSLQAPPEPFGFEPYLSFYCIKKLTVNLLNQNQYRAVKVRWMYDVDVAGAQSMAAVHFNPENILKRTNFQQLKEEKQPQDANQPPKSEEAT